MSDGGPERWRSRAFRRPSHKPVQRARHVGPNDAEWVPRPPKVCLPDSEMTLRLLCRAPTPALPDVALTAVQLLRRQLLRRAPVELTAPKRRVARGVPGKPSRVKAVPKPAKRPRPPLVLLERKKTPEEETPELPVRSPTVSRPPTDEKVQSEGAERLKPAKQFVRAGSWGLDSASSLDLQALDQDGKVAQFARGETEASTLDLPFSEALAERVFQKLSEQQEIHYSNLLAAMKLLGYLHADEDWVLELFREIAPSYNTLQIAEFMSFVKSYAAKHHEYCAWTFAQHQVDGLMDALGLQAAMEVFDIHLLPYVAEEVMMEISQGQRLMLPEFEAALALILQREGFCQKEFEELRLLFNQNDRGSGQVEVSDVKVMLHWLGFSGIHLAEDLAIKARGAAGSLSFQEFLICMRLLRGIELDSVRGLMQAAADDGLLEVGHLPDLLAGMGYETWDPQVVTETLEDSELQAHSKLELGDVWRFLVEYRRKEGFCRKELQAISETFRRHDEDNSGELDNFESPLALRMLGFPVGYNEVESWLLKVDVDESGALNLLEFRKLARMLQAQDVDRFRGVFKNHLPKHGFEGRLPKEQVVKVLELWGFRADCEHAHYGEEQFLSLCFDLLKRRRCECRANGGWSCSQLEFLRTRYNSYVSNGHTEVAEKDLIHLLQDVLPQMSRDPLFRPQLRAILRQVNVESTGKLGFREYLTFLQLCRSAQEKSVARRQQEVVEETGFSPFEVQELRDLFLTAGTSLTGCITFEETWRLINSTTSLGHRLTVELNELFREQLLRRSDRAEPAEQALDFADFLRLMKRIMDLNFGKLAG